MEKSKTNNSKLKTSRRLPTGLIFVAPVILTLFALASLMSANKDQEFWMISLGMVLVVDLFLLGFGYILVSLFFNKSAKNDILRVIVTIIIFALYALAICVGYMAVSLIGLKSF
jgi:uncharacterized membrane protein